MTPPVPKRYAVIEQIGQGGMATVWRARDTLTSTDVALKVLLPHLRDNELIAERFRREIAAVRRIDHPNAVAIYDLIETEAVSCLVLEYFDGLDLKRMIRRQGALPADEVIRIGEQVLDALEAAHRQGVIHRDIKPHNILVDDEGRAKLTDFGIARIDDLARITSNTMPFGTPEYVAPELLASPRGDPRADLYSLGVTLFEAASGHPPFVASSPFELLRLHTEQTAPQLQSDLPVALTRAIACALEKDPDDRFDTAREMRDALTAKTSFVPARAAATKASCYHCDAPLPSFFPACLECSQTAVNVAATTSGGHRLLIGLQPPVDLDLSHRHQLTHAKEQRLTRTLRRIGARLSGDQKLSWRMRRLPLVVANQLDAAEATELKRLLAVEDIETVIGDAGRWGALRTFLSVRCSLVSYSVFGGFFALFASAFFTMIFGGFTLTSLSVIFSQWLAASYLVVLYLWIRDSIKAMEPIAQFSGTTGHASTSDAFFARASDLYARANTVRLRKLIHRTVSRGLDLSATVRATPALAGSMGPTLNTLLSRALDRTERIVRGEVQADVLDATRIADRILTVNERIDAAASTDEAEALINEKADLMTSLETADETQHELARGYSQLLEISRRLNAMSAQLADVEEDPDEASITALLHELTDAVDAHSELNESTSVRQEA